VERQLIVRPWQMNDMVSFIAALIAVKISTRTNNRKEFSFGWQRAQILSAFFNGVFLFALAISIFLQSIERFVALESMYHGRYMIYGTNETRG
jgi:Co/Zn/Cd efflux system component